MRPPRAPENDVPDYASGVSMTTISPVFNSHVVAIEETESMTSSTASVPPAKPQRSFREKRQDDREIIDHLKGCEGQTVGEEEAEETVEAMNQDFRRETEEEEEEEERERGSEKMRIQECNTKKVNDEEWGLPKGKEGCDEEREEQEEGGGLQDLNKFSDGETEFTPIEECEETKINEEIGEQVQKEGEEKRNTFTENNGESSGQENRSREGEPGRGNWEEDKGTDGIREEEEGWREEREYDGDADGEEEESPLKEQPPRPPAPRPARPSRVIRLYQYDDDGQLYSHVPQPAPAEPGPAPRLQQRSISLTRLSTIMAAAWAGPLDPKGSERAESPTK